MSENPAQQVTIDNVRTAIALNRQMQAVERFKKTDIAQLEGALTQLHADLYKGLPNTSGAMNRKDKYREIVHELQKKLLDDNKEFLRGHSPEDLVAVLAQFYHDMRSLQPFGADTEETLNCCMVAFGQREDFKNVHGGRVEFTRLDHEDVAALQANTDVQAIRTAFAHAMDGSRSQRMENKGTFKTWPSGRKEIGDMPFLSYEDESGEYLVTVRGGLVRFDAALKAKIEAQIDSKKQIADYDAIPAEQIVRHLDNTEEIKALRNKEYIDGIHIENGAEPLCCLDVNILTGLRGPNHNRFMEVLRDVIPEEQKAKLDVFDALGEESPLHLETEERKRLRRGTAEKMMEEMLEKAKIIEPDDTERERLERIIKTGCNHLLSMKEQMEDKTAEIFTGRTSVRGKPCMYMTMGGSGSGKSLVKGIISKQTKGNFVETSLDDFREHSDLYHLIRAANHHSDDYKLVEPFANKLRDMVAEHAREHHFNLLYDGSGIEYKDRYDKEVKKFKKAGFSTHVVAVDVPTEQAVTHIMGRFKERNRTLPWKVTTSKHRRSPTAYLQAAEDPNLDSVCLYIPGNGNGSGSFKPGELVSEVFNLRDIELRELQTKQKAGELHDAIGKLRDSDKSTKSTLYVQNPLPALEENNVYYISHPIGEKNNRVTVIYDAREFSRYMAKVLENPYASDAESLSIKTYNTSHLGIFSNYKDPSRINTLWAKRVWGAIEAIDRMIH